MKLFLISLNIGGCPHFLWTYRDRVDMFFCIIYFHDEVEASFGETFVQSKMSRVSHLGQKRDYFKPR